VLCRARHLPQSTAGAGALPSKPSQTSLHPTHMQPAHAFCITLTSSCAPPTPQVVQEEYEQLFPGQVVSVQPVYDTTELEPLDTEYDKLSQKLWDLIGDYSNKLRHDKKIKKRKQVRSPPAACCPRRPLPSPRRGRWRDMGDHRPE